MIIYKINFKGELVMKKIKSYIIASILGLLNIVPGNANAEFVENKNFPYLCDQADRIVKGIHWFRSKTDPKEVFYTLPREYTSPKKTDWRFVYNNYSTRIFDYNKKNDSNLEDDVDKEDVKKWKRNIKTINADLCEKLEELESNSDEDEKSKINQRISRLKKRRENLKAKISNFYYRTEPLDLSCLKDYHFTQLILDQNKKEIHPEDYDEGDKKLYRYLYDTYDTATSCIPGDSKEIITDFSNLLDDNPLDNLGWFYSGKPVETEPLVQRVLNDKLRKSDKGKINLEMYAIDIGNTENTGFKTPQGFSKNLKWNDKQQALFDYFTENMYLQHGQPKRNPKYTVESNFSSKILDPDNSNYSAKYNENYKESSLQNQKHVFFSPVMPGFEDGNMYSSSFRYNVYSTIENKDFLNLPLIGMSDEMTDTIQIPSYTGKPIDVLKMLFHNELFKSFEHCENLEDINQLFTRREVRIPTYTIVNKWYNQKGYYKNKSDDQIYLEQKLTK